MTTDLDLRALGIRAVACKSWRWMPGMLTLPWQDEYGEDSHPAWRCGEHNMAPFACDDMCGGIPDLSDPATLGCLLALVRTAWGCPDLYVSLSAVPGWWELLSHSKSDDEPYAVVQGSLPYRLTTQG